MNLASISNYSECASYINNTTISVTIFIGIEKPDTIEPRIAVKTLLKQNLKMMKNQKIDLGGLENRSFILDISGMNSLGQGVGKIEGFTIFVDGAITGEKIEAKITEFKKNYCIGKINKIMKPSPYRIMPFCNVFGYCGGCSLQHISYGYQLTYKTRKVKDEVERISGITGIRINEIIAMEKPLNYRNKAEYFINNQKNIGFYARESHEVVEHQACHICTIESNEIKNFFKALMIKNNNFLLESLTIRKSFRTSEVMVIIQAYENKNINSLIENSDAFSRHSDMGTSIFKGLAGKLAAKFPSIKSIYLNKIGKHHSSHDLLYGKKTIRENISNYSFDISPGSFFQVNTIGAEILFATALKYAEFSGNEEVLDLYCGTGASTILMAGHCKIIIGVEVRKDTIDDAKANARLNGVKNVEFVQGETLKILREFDRKNYNQKNSFDAAIVDPPRKGLEAEVIEVIANLKIKKIVYISCNPSTLARDIKRFSGFGYSTREIQPVDMFPHTEHVECVAIITS
jgi:23S rRNA (uracil1939-C5)-methyltransferase